MDQLPYSSFEGAVSALVYSMARPGGGKTGELQPPYNDIARFVLGQHARMAGYLRTPLRFATILFDLLALPVCGSRFHVLPPSSREKRIAKWKHSPLSFQRDLMRYFESLTLMALYDRVTQVRECSPKDAAIPPPSQGVIHAPQHEMAHEIVVVGSGPGGAITACLLAEAGRDVLLIEEGDYLTLNSCAPFSRDEMTQKYRNGGQTIAMGGNKIAYVEGRCVGGGSEINSGLYHRTPPDILERWRREFHVEELDEADLLPHFEACEKDLSVSLLPGRAPEASLKLHEGALRLGWKSLEIPRWFRHDASGKAGGKRQSMTETFVPRFLNSGGKLLPATRVDRIREEIGNWLLTASHVSKGNVRIKAGTLFICGGAIQTPALLRRSGIKRGIGESLQLHPTVKVAAEFPDTVNSAAMGVPVHQVKEFAPRISFGCSISSPPYLALALMDHQEAARKVATDWSRMAIYYAMISPAGRGAVRALPMSRDPLVRYRLVDPDRRELARGLRKLCEALFAAGASELYPCVSGMAPFKSPKDLAQAPEALPNGRSNLMTIHLFSSCPMGEDKARCATDSFGRLHGLKNLHVSDASLLCTAPGVNPQGTIMAIARRNVLHFLNHSK